MMKRVLKTNTLNKISLVLLTTKCFKGKVRFKLLPLERTHKAALNLNKTKLHHERMKNVIGWWAQLASGW